MINFGLPVEESDLEFEQLQQLELDDEESPIGKETDVLRGKWIPFRRQWTGRCPAGVEYRKVKKLLSSNKNLYDIPMGMRGPVYRFWEKKLNKHMLEKLRGHLKEYKSTVNSIRVTKVRWGTLVWIIGC
jgi:helicase required for RNAi-mediated heterochromatin assembly 1